MKGGIQFVAMRLKFDSDRTFLTDRFWSPVAAGLFGIADEISPGDGLPFIADTTFLV